MSPCFVCSEPHWVNGQLVRAAIDPMAACIHRERELVEWVHFLIRRKAIADNLVELLETRAA